MRWDSEGVKSYGGPYQYLHPGKCDDKGSTSYRDYLWHRGEESDLPTRYTPIILIPFSILLAVLSIVGIILHLLLR